MTQDKETIILAGLLSNERFTRGTIPFIKSEYFEDSLKRKIFDEFSKYFVKYSIVPTSEILAIELDKCSSLNDDEYKNIIQDIKNISNVTVTENYEWLVDTTEKYCQERAIYNAILSSISILDGEDKKLSKDAIPELLTDALGVTFDPSIGHDYLEDNRYDFYHNEDEKIPFGLKFLDKVTNGGVPRKTLNAFMGGPGSGKSMMMCSLASHHLIHGKNVLYITMEMAEERIAERIDANLMNVSLQELPHLDRDAYNSRFSGVQEKSRGKLIIKEYPTVGASAITFKHLLHELKIKKEFIPDIIFIDYLNICASSRYKNSENSYGYIKSVAEELRGLAVESNSVMITATQTNRGGASDSDAGLESTADSFGIPQTLDSFFALITSDELAESGKLIVKQLKNRFGDISENTSFAVGIDRSKMRIYDTEESTSFGSVVEANNSNNMNGTTVPIGRAASRFADFKL